MPEDIKLSVCLYRCVLNEEQRSDLKRIESADFKICNVHSIYMYIDYTENATIFKLNPLP